MSQRPAQDEVVAALDLIASNLTYYQQEVGPLKLSDHFVVTDSALATLRRALTEGTRIEGAACRHPGGEPDRGWAFWPVPPHPDAYDEYPATLIIYGPSNEEGE